MGVPDYWGVVLIVNKKTKKNLEVTREEKRKQTGYIARTCSQDFCEGGQRVGENSGKWSVIIGLVSQQELVRVRGESCPYIEKQMDIFQERRLGRSQEPVGFEIYDNHLVTERAWRVAWALICNHICMSVEPYVPSARGQGNCSFGKQKTLFTASQGMMVLNQPLEILLQSSQSLFLEM